MSVLDKLAQTLVAVYPFVDKTAGNASTVAVASLALATTQTIAAAGTFANGMDVRIGSGETQEIVRIASGGGTTSLVYAKGLKFDHPVGDVVVEQNAINLGVPEADGFKLNWSGESVDVYTAVSRLAYTALTGFTDIKFAWRFPTVTVDSVAFALGMPRSLLVGDGTAAAQTGTVGPRLMTTDGSQFGAATGVNLKAVVQLIDGTYVTIELYNLSFDPTAFSMNFSRGQLTTVPIAGLASSGAMEFTATPFVPYSVVQTYAASRNDVFSEITGVSTLTDSGTVHTLTAPAAVGAYVLAVDSVATFAANTWVQLGTGDTQEFHFVHSIASLNLNLRTQVQRLHAVSEPVTLQTVTPIAGIVGGFAVSISGSVTVLRAETIRNSLQLKVGNAAINFASSMNAITAANMAMALGVPSSAIISNVMPIGKAMATAAAVDLLFTGLTQGQKNLTMVGWQGAAVIGGESVYTQAGESRIPFAFKPSGWQMLVNA